MEWAKIEEHWKLEKKGGRWRNGGRVREERPRHVGVIGWGGKVDLRRERKKWRGEFW